MKNIPFNDLRSSNLQYKSKFISAFKQVLSDGDLILGEQVRVFEQEFSDYIGTRFGIGVGSGTDAIVLALQALDLQPQDEVLIPVNVYPVAFAVIAAGYTIKLVDIDTNTLNIDVEDLARKITKKTRAVLLVHLFGNAAPVSDIMKIAKRNKLYVIEDCSQAHGTMYKGTRVGNFGIISCFSLYPTKNLGALGDGGIILTNSVRLAKKLKALRQFGEFKRYHSELLGRVTRLDELQAAFLRIKLTDLDNQIQKRLQKATLYRKLLTTVSQIQLPPASDQLNHSYHLFVIQAQSRDKLQKYLHEHEIQTAIHYPLLIHQVKSCKHLVPDAHFPNAETSAKKILSLPFYPNISTVDITFVCKTIADFYHTT